MLLLHHWQHLQVAVWLPYPAKLTRGWIHVGWVCMGFHKDHKQAVPCWDKNKERLSDDEKVTGTTMDTFGPESSFFTKIYMRLQRLCAKTCQSVHLTAIWCSTFSTAHSSDPTYRFWWRPLSVQNPLRQINDILAVWNLSLPDLLSETHILSHAIITRACKPTNSRGVYRWCITWLLNDPKLRLPKSY